MTIPSEGVSHFNTGWLAGIIDGEGSVVMYKNHNFLAIRLYIINTDIVILEKALDILDKLDVMAYIYHKTASKRQREGSYAYTKPCYEIIVARRDALRKLLPLIYPHLVGDKKQRVKIGIDYLNTHPFNAGRKTPRVETERLTPSTNLQRFEQIRMKLQSVL